MTSSDRETIVYGLIFLLALVSIVLLIGAYYYSNQLTQAKANPSPWLLQDKYWYCLEPNGDTNNSQCQPIGHPAPLVTQKQPSVMTDTQRAWASCEYGTSNKGDIQNALAMTGTESSNLDNYVVGLVDVNTACDSTNPYGAISTRKNPIDVLNNNNDPSKVTDMTCDETFNFSLLYCQATSMPTTSGPVIDKTTQCVNYGPFIKGP